MLDFNYYIFFEVLKNFDVANYLIAGIVLFAMILAIFTEDAAAGSPRLSWVLGEFLPIQESMFVLNAKVEKCLLKKQNSKCADFVTFLYGSWMELLLSIYERRLLSLLKQWMSKTRKKIQFYTSAIMLKRKAESRRQFFYFMFKNRYHLPIKKEETVMESYLDVKRELVRTGRWSFMWIVSDVKSDYVICENTQARPISSYSYLDFIREPLVQQAAIDAAKKWSTGNHGPRMLGGNSQILRDLEKITGKFFGRNDSILGVCGFLACMSGIAAVAIPETLVLYDNKSHTCVKIGIKIGGAKRFPFRHNDYAQLEVLLIKHRKKYKECWICIESVYSMDGDIADLPVIKKLCTRYNAKLFIDEAHGLGALGTRGRGLEDHFDMMGAADMIVGTFSKSIGGVGGFIVASDDVIEFLDFHSISNVFSAPLPAYCAGGAIKAFELIDSQPWRLEKLRFNTKYLRTILKTGMGYWPKDYPESHKYVIGGDDCTSVIPVIFPNDPDRMFQICNVLLKMKWMISAVAYPACPLEAPRFRVTATSAYSVDYMNNFVHDLVHATVSIPPSPLEF